MEISTPKDQPAAVALVWHRCPFAQCLERKFGWELIDSSAKYEAMNWKAYRQIIFLADLRWEEEAWLEMQGLKLAFNLGCRFPQLRERMVIVSRFSEPHLHKHYEQTYFKSVAAVSTLLDWTTFCRQLSSDGVVPDVAQRLHSAYVGLWALLVNFDSYDDSLLKLAETARRELKALEETTAPQVEVWALRSLLEKLFPRLFQIYTAARVAVKGPLPLQGKERQVYHFCLTWYEEHSPLADFLEQSTLLWQECHFPKLTQEALLPLLHRCQDALFELAPLLLRLENGGKRIRVMDQLRS